MLYICLMLAYLTCFSFIMGLFPIEWEYRPRLQTLAFERDQDKKKRRLSAFLRALLRTVSKINKPVVSGGLRARIAKDLAMSQVNLTPEEFFFLKEAGIVIALVLTFPAVQPDIVFFWLCMSFAVGYMLPEFWLKGKIKKVKAAIIKELPDTIDLLGLCVNAGLDFMLALKWVVEKSPPTVLTNELNIIMQEINVGKTRRDALKDFSTKYELPDVSTFTRTLIQADKMGTSVNEALNLLSEDMRLARFRRGEQLALKAPLKMLVPLLFFIFPVVGVLVAGPIFLDFMQNNPMEQLAGASQ